MIGDWYDTLQHPGSSGPNIASLVRWVASDYNTIDEMALREGKIEYESSQIFHCHILSHEGKYDTIDVLVIGTVLYLIIFMAVRARSFRQERKLCIIIFSTSVVFCVHYYYYYSKLR